MSLALAFFTEMYLSKGQFCKKYTKKGHFNENADTKGLLCKNYYKKGYFGEKYNTKGHFGKTGTIRIF